MQTPHLSVKTHLFEIKIGHLRDLCRSDEKLFFFFEGGVGVVDQNYKNKFIYNGYNSQRRKNTITGISVESDGQSEVFSVG